MKEIIFSASSEFEQIALAEIQKIDPRSLLLEWLDPGVGLVRLDQEDFQSLSSKLLDHKAVFVRHIFPVLETVIFENNDFEEILKAIRSCNNLSSPISIQIRTFQSPHSRSDLFQFLSQSLSEFEIEVKNPRQIISIVCTSKFAYLGISDATENLSSWAGGVHRLAQEKEQISRAEFKLLEAIALFNLTLPESGKALDLGASPGGWTRILTNKGLDVVAVDPADLAESLKIPQVTHHRQLVQQFLPDCRAQFDVIVNDMRMDAIASAKIMVSASHLLKENGWAVMTLKLPNKKVQAAIRSAIATLEKSYEIIGARNLYHNRQEATLALKKLSESA